MIRRIPLVTAAVLGCMVATVAAVGVGQAAAARQTQTRTDTSIVTSGDCPREARLIGPALERSTLRVDVNGDGELDRVAVRTDPTARRMCRAFVGVHVRGGRSYSTHLGRSAVPPPWAPAKIVALPDLGQNPGAEIVVDTHARADSLFAQLFTLTRARLLRVRVPGLPHGNFVVVGGGATFPHGADCTRRGAMILSSAESRDRGRRFAVTRRTYPVRGERLRFLDPVTTRATVRSGVLTDRFPEFILPNFQACTGRVVR